ncbi:hypothetical protein DB347_13680, partial [Opitutaceae bacterium EW11]
TTTDTTTTTPTTTPTTTTDTTTTTPTTTPVVTTPAFVSQYSSSDVGTVGVAGNTNYEATSGVFSISGAGSDIGGTVDAFQFAAAPVSGDTQSTVKIESFAVANSTARAGLMLRESTTANGIFAGVLVSGSGSVQFVRRTITGGAALVTAGKTLPFPIYLRLNRVGSIFTAWYSSNGSTWATLGSVEFSMASSARMGLAVSSKSISQLGVIRASAPSLDAGSSTTLSGLTVFDIGASNANASASASGNQISLTGCGDFVPGAARESLALLGKKNAVNLAIATQVLPFRAGTLPSRAGLTIRESLSDNARMASLCIDSQGRVVFEYRTSPGGFAVTTTFNETARHLLLDRVGKVITAMVSDDGNTWRTIATTSIRYSQATYIGLVTASSQASTPVTADFDGFEVVTH